MQIWSKWAKWSFQDFSIVFTIIQAFLIKRLNFKRTWIISVWQHLTGVNITHRETRCKKKKKKRDDVNLCKRLKLNSHNACASRTLKHEVWFEKRASSRQVFLMFKVLSHSVVVACILSHISPYHDNMKMIITQKLLPHLYQMAETDRKRAWRDDDENILLEGVGTTVYLMKTIEWIQVFLKQSATSDQKLQFYRQIWDCVHLHIL